MNGKNLITREKCVIVLNKPLRYIGNDENTTRRYSDPPCSHRDGYGPDFPVDLIPLKIET